MDQALTQPMREPAAGAADEAITLTVPMPPTVTNSAHGRSRHWRALEREKTQYWAALDALQLRGLVPPPPALPFARVTVRSSMVLRGAMDDDNAAARHKWVLDWLRTRGYIVSDRRSHCRWEAFPEQRVTRSEPARITITINLAGADARKETHGE